MKVPVKFRGYNGGYVYGNHLMVCSDIPHLIYIIDVEEDAYYLVYRNTVRRLVGYDENGEEIYEKCIVKGWD